MNDNQEVLKRLGRIASCLEVIAQHLLLARFPVPQLLKVSEAAKIMQTSERTTRHFITSGQLKASRFDCGKMTIPRIASADLQVHRGDGDTPVSPPKGIAPNHSIPL
jgi:hypothetical protein